MDEFESTAEFRVAFEFLTQEILDGFYIVICRLLDLFDALRVGC